MGETAIKNISFPRYAEYNCAFRYIVEEALGARYVMPSGTWGTASSLSTSRTTT